MPFSAQLDPKSDVAEYERSGAADELRAAPRWQTRADDSFPRALSLQGRFKSDGSLSRLRGGLTHIMGLGEGWLHACSEPSNTSIILRAQTAA